MEDKERRKFYSLDMIQYELNGLL